MSIAIEIVGYGLVVPTAVSMAMSWFCRRGLPRSIAQRYTLSVALAAGFLVGYALLRPATDWLPTRHRDWLPYLSIAAMILGPIGCARGVWAGERWLLALIVAFVSACLLVPQWESLQPTRNLHVGLLSAYFLVLIAGLEPLGSRISSTRLLLQLAVVAFVLAGTILATVSVQFGQVTGLLGAATVGCSVASIWFNEPRAVRGFIPVFSVLVGGLAFVGYIEPDPPLNGLLLLPAAPLALWLTELLPWSKEGRASTIAQAEALNLVLAAGVSWTLLAS